MRPRIPPVSDLRWSIKIAAPSSRRLWWGDFHFAAGVARALKRLGQHVEIDAHEAWYKETGRVDDVVLVLRGLERYDPDPKQINLLWVISHPDDIAATECDAFDHSFVASTRGAEAVLGTRRPAEQLLQATDGRRFQPGPPQGELRHDVLFVGNTRWRLRPVVQDALTAQLPVSVYGDGWGDLLPNGVLRGERIPNRHLPGYYRSAGVVLNDHWGDMRRQAFVSNRIFDAAACGASVVTDRIDGMEGLFGDVIRSYDRPEELGPIVRGILDSPDADIGRRLELARHVRDRHSFAARARRLVSVAQALAIERHTRTYGDGQPVR